MTAERLTLTSYAYRLDGGTTTLFGHDETGQEHAFTLIQHAWPQASSDDAIPGRLYLNDEPVGIRSPLEARLLVLLRTADVRYTPPGQPPGHAVRLSPNALVLGDDIRQVVTRSPEDNIRALSARIVAFVESDEFLRFAERVAMAADPTRYDVWVAADDADRNQVLVRLSSLHGWGIGPTRDYLASGEPLARGATALGVADLIREYQWNRVPLRIEPAFPWMSFTSRPA